MFLALEVLPMPTKPQPSKPEPFDAGLTLKDKCVMAGQVIGLLICLALTIAGLAHIATSTPPWAIVLAIVILIAISR